MSFADVYAAMSGSKVHLNEPKPFMEGFASDSYNFTARNPAICVFVHDGVWFRSAEHPPPLDQIQDLPVTENPLSMTTGERIRNAAFFGDEAKERWLWWVHLGSLLGCFLRGAVTKRPSRANVIEPPKSEFEFGGRKGGCP
jgi:hypothetical protein